MAPSPGRRPRAELGGTPQAEEYRERIMAAVPEGAAFRPLMTLYLTDKTPPEEVRAAPRAPCNRRGASLIERQLREE